MDPVNIPAKFEVRSFTRSWDNRGYSKNLGRPWIRPRSLFSKIFHGLVFGSAKTMLGGSCKFLIVTCVPKIIMKIAWQ